MHTRNPFFYFKSFTLLACVLLGGVAATPAAIIFQTLNGGTWSSATWGTPAAAPAAGNDYVSDGSTTATLITGINPSGFNFPGNSLTLKNGVDFVVGRNAGANYIMESGAKTTAAANRNVTTSVQVASGQSATFDGANFTLTYLALISGTGNITTSSGTGNVLISNTGNTFTGNWVVSSGTLTLADNAVIKFAIGANGVNNSVGGTAALALSGDFVFDLSGAAAVNGNSWQIVNTASLSETFDTTFSVQGFSESSNVWTNGSGYSFSEATGILSYSAVPEPPACVFFVGGLISLWGLRRRIH